MNAAVRKILGYSSWWLVMGGFFALTAWLAGGEAPGAGLVFAVTVANTFFIAAAEQLLPRKPGANLLRDGQSLNDMAHGVLFSFAGRPVAAGAGLAVVAWLGQRWGGIESPWPHDWPLAAQVAPNFRAVRYSTSVSVFARE